MTNDRLTEVELQLKGFAEGMKLYMIGLRELSNEIGRINGGLKDE